MADDTSPVISDKSNVFRRFDHPDFRFGKKVQALTLGNTTVYECITRSNIKSYKGWYPVPTIPEDMR